MRATLSGLAALAILGWSGSLAHAQPWSFPPAAGCEPCASGFYTSNGYCWYGPNYCFRGPCLPPYPFNGVLPFQGKRPGQSFANAPGQMPPGMAPGQMPPGMAPGMVPGMPPGAPGGVPGVPGYLPPPLTGQAGFPTHPFARSPRDFFMFGQEHND